MNRHRAIIAALWLALAATVAGCVDSNRNYSQYTTLPPQGWCFSDSVQFTPTHSDSVATATLIVGIRHTDAYSYDKLWIEVTHQSATGSPATPMRDTLCFRLTDRLGTWNGIGIGTSFQHTDTISHPITHVSGTPITLRHIMRTDTLAGISQVGIFFNQTNATQR